MDDGGTYSPVGDARVAKPSFSARRETRSWVEDTADWTENSGTSNPGFPRGEDGVVPPESIMGRLMQAGSLVGSAVSVGQSGSESRLWLTARHLIASCATIEIAGGGDEYGSWLLAGRPVAVHRAADLALVETLSSYADTRALAVMPAGNQFSTEAVHVGFPGGRPAAIYSIYLGETHVRWIDNTLSPGTYRVWAEHSRVPVSIGGLGGLSGGATLSPTGEVIGIVVGVSERRARILTTRRSQNSALIDSEFAVAAGEESMTEAALPFDRLTYPTFARRLIEQRRVARLSCGVGMPIN